MTREDLKARLLALPGLIAEAETALRCRLAKEALQQVEDALLEPDRISGKNAE
jgi:hypothetical protein